MHSTFFSATCCSDRGCRRSRQPASSSACPPWSESCVLVKPDIVIPPILLPDVVRSTAFLGRPYFFIFYFFPFIFFFLFFIFKQDRAAPACTMIKYRRILRTPSKLSGSSVRPMVIWHEATTLSRKSLFSVRGGPLIRDFTPY